MYQGRDCCTEVVHVMANVITWISELYPMATLLLLILEALEHTDDGNILLRHPSLSSPVLKCIKLRGRLDIISLLSMQGFSEIRHVG